ncbi:MAG: hypothetical protein H6730_14620 [Deltaproteobacteria bacterium]|nr:hypothetical protein [Deltaproteobacteria bacterium]
MRLALVAKIASFLGSALLLACASDPRASPMLAQRVALEDEGPAPPPPAPPRAPKRQSVSMVDHARTFRNAQLCEQAAQALRTSSPDKAWSFLRACAQRDDFTELDLVLRPPWIDEVKRHEKTGVHLVAQIVAHRGGNLKLDLGLAQDQGVQLFDLGTAHANSEVFRGRYALFRGRVADLKPKGQTHMIRIAQTTLQSENDKVRWNYYDAREARLKGRSSEVVQRYDSARDRYNSELVVGTRTRSLETGLEVVAYLEKLPADLKVGDEHLFLVRYEERTGAPPRSDDETDAEVQTALCALVDHFTPLEAGP